MQLEFILIHAGKAQDAIRFRPIWGTIYHYSVYNFEVQNYF